MGWVMFMVGYPELARKQKVTLQLELQIGSEVSDVRYEGHHKPIPGGLTVAVLATDTLKPNI